MSFKNIKTAEQLDEEKAQQALDQAEKNRKRAYQSEADPLFFKWQAGESTQEDWQTKRQEIKQRYPYPDEWPAKPV